MDTIQLPIRVAVKGGGAVRFSQKIFLLKSSLN